jgi:vitamin B12 transporter
MIPLIALAALAMQAPLPPRAAPGDTARLAPIIVTADRLPVPAAVVATAVTVISGATLRAAGIRTVADALRTVPGAAVVATGSYGAQTSLFLRGGESDYVKVLIDGVPQNQPGGAFDFAHLTTDGIDRIEIVRGPVSVLYGSDAVAGVVQIFTQDGLGGSRRTAAVRAGTYGTTEASLALTGSDGGALGYSLFASRFGSNGIYRVNNEYRDAAFAGRLAWRPDPRSDVGLSLRYGDDVFHFPTNGAGMIADTTQRQSTRGPGVGLDAGRFLTTRLEARVSAVYHEDDVRFDDDLYSYHGHDRIRRIGTGARANLHLGTGAVVTGGAEVEWQRQRGTTLDTTRRDAAMYAQAVTGLDRELSLSAGLRLDDNEQFGAHVTGRAGATWRSDARTRLRVSAGTGFKEPTFYENFATGFVRGNPRLEPEQSTSWEIGVERAVRTEVTVGATYFDQRFRHLVLYSFTPVGPDSVNYVNVARALARGVELTVEASLGGGRTATVAYTRLVTRVLTGGADPAFETGRPLLRRPRDATALRLATPVGGRGTVSLTTVYVGRRDDFDYGAFTRVTLPPHTRADLAGEYRLTTGRAGLPGFTATMRVDNVFDAPYQEVKNFPAPRRAFLLGVRFAV